MAVEGRRRGGGIDLVGAAKVLAQDGVVRLLAERALATGRESAEVEAHASHHPLLATRLLRDAETRNDNKNNPPLLEAETPPDTSLAMAQSSAASEPITHYRLGNKTRAERLYFVTESRRTSTNRKKLKQLWLHFALKIVCRRVQDYIIFRP